MINEKELCFINALSGLNSLGETHSATMCFVIGCDIFLSDDNDSKELAGIIKRKKNFDLTVYNREEACKRIVELGTNTLIKADRNVLSHEPEHTETYE